jgi:hypothetical protein
MPTGKRYLTHGEPIKMATEWAMDDDLSDFLQDQRFGVEQQR